MTDLTIIIIIQGSAVGLTGSLAATWTHLGVWSLQCESKHNSVCMALHHIQFTPGIIHNNSFLAFSTLHVYMHGCSLIITSSLMQGAFIFFFHVIRSEPVRIVCMSALIVGIEMPVLFLTFNIIVLSKKCIILLCSFLILGTS